MVNTIKFWFIKHTRFEFWPYWFAYIPVYFYYIYLSIKAKSFTFFTTANPGIYLGGFVGESKKNILKKINPTYLPATIYCKNEFNVSKIVDLLAAEQMQFPLIAKPDVGERGSQVEKITNKQELEKYVHSIGEDFIIQSFIDYEIELGIMYYHYPNGTLSGINSIVLKEYLSIVGNGVDTIETLIKNHLRAQGRLAYLLNKFSYCSEQILPANEKMLLEPIGNHIRGTKFINANHLINAKLIAVFDKIAKPIDGFYIGRFDLKVKSINDLYEGKNIQIMELNGVSSEPAHIYDPSTFILSAYKALFQHYKLIFIIAKQNIALGENYLPFRLVWKQIRMHLSK
ncbi:MAG: hypothetical protein JHD28_07860 [Bacteroidia bacterium]|nr:hypothetical protein [Bacteroidia bacterium]